MHTVVNSSRLGLHDSSVNSCRTLYCSALGIVRRNAMLPRRSEMISFIHLADNGIRDTYWGGRYGGVRWTATCCRVEGFPRSRRRGGEWTGGEWTGRDGAERETAFPRVTDTNRPFVGHAEPWTDMDGCLKNDTTGYSVCGTILEKHGILPPQPLLRPLFMVRISKNQVCSCSTAAARPPIAPPAGDCKPWARVFFYPADPKAVPGKRRFGIFAGVKPHVLSLRCAVACSKSHRGS